MAFCVCLPTPVWLHVACRNFELHVVQSKLEVYKAGRSCHMQVICPLQVTIKSMETSNKIHSKIFADKRLHPSLYFHKS